MKQLALLVMLLLSSSAWAASAVQSLPVPLKQGLEHLESLSGFSCQFEQSIFYSDGSKQVYRGNLAVAKGGKFRWQYHMPYEQLYISKGDGVWLYEPDLMQAQWLQSINAVDPIAMRLLEGRVKSEEVHVLDMAAGVYHLRLGDKVQATELWLALDKGNMPMWFETRDSLDNRNRMRLLSIDAQKPEPKVFEFNVPEDVDVIDGNGNVIKRHAIEKTMMGSNE